MSKRSIIFAVIALGWAFVSNGQTQENIEFLEGRVEQIIDDYFLNLQLLWEEHDGDLEEAKDGVVKSFYALFVNPTRGDACFNDLDFTRRELSKTLSAEGYLSRLSATFDASLLLNEVRNARTFGEPFPKGGSLFIPVLVQKTLKGDYYNGARSFDETFNLQFNFLYEYDATNETFGDIKIYDIVASQAITREFSDAYAAYKKRLPSLGTLEDIQKTTVENYYRQLALLSTYNKRIRRAEGDVDGQVLSDAQIKVEINALIDSGNEGYYDAYKKSTVRNGSIRQYVDHLATSDKVLFVRPSMVLARSDCNYKNKRSSIYKVQFYIDRKEHTEFILVSRRSKKIIKTYETLEDAERDGCSNIRMEDLQTATGPGISLSTDYSVYKRRKEIRVTWDNAVPNELLEFKILKSTDTVHTFSSFIQSPLETGAYSFTLPKLKTGSDYRMGVLGINDAIQENSFTIKKRYNGVWLAVGVSAALGGGYGLYCLVTGNCKNQIQTIEKPTPPCPPGFDNCN